MILGSGIAAHQQQDIFSEFHQLENHNSSEGIGLGLTIVDRICRLLAHRITLKSELDKGSSFSVQVPLADDNTAKKLVHAESQNTKPHEDEAKKASLSASTFLKERTILLIENDEQVACAMQSLLGDWGANVTWIKGINDSLPATTHFDVLIADYHLNAGETGTECVKALQLQEVTFGLTLLITANRSNEIREEAASLGMAYLPKPVKPAALKRLLKQGVG